MTKTTSTKALLLALLLLTGMIVSPVCAWYEITAEPFEGVLEACTIVSHALGLCEFGPEKIDLGKMSNLSYDVSPQGYALQRINIDIPTNTAVNFTLTYGNGLTVDGWMEYRNSTDCVDWYPYDNFCQYSGVSIDTEVSGYSYRGFQEIGRVDIVGYAKNWTSDTQYQNGFVVYDSVGGVSDLKNIVFYSVPNIESSVIYKIDLVAMNQVNVLVYQAPLDYVARASSRSILDVANEWITKIKEISGSVLDFVISLFWILKFFFVDNLLLIVALWISVSMAYSAISTKNIFAFYTKFFRTQRALLEFIMGLWDVLVRVVGGMVQALLKWL